MKERPILFSAPMVRALLDGSKTQTRRVVKLPPAPDHLGEWRATTIGGPDGGRTAAGNTVPLQGAIWHTRTGKTLCSPYGQPGDRLWVRETHFAFGRWETRYSAKKGRDEWHFVDMTIECEKAYLYEADRPRPQPLAGKRDGGATPKWWKRPAIFMPRAASRIDLEGTSVRVERLQDISQADARAEGAPPSHPSIDRVSREFGYADFPRSWYAQLWEQINGAGSWSANPWVWVVEFKRVKP
jgi:hypothetical protein